MITEPDVKSCSLCKHPFPATTEYFVRSSKSKSGLSSRCRECKKHERALMQERQEAGVTDDTVACAICGLICAGQIAPSHLAKHGLTTQQYRDMGHDIFGVNRRNQIVQQNKIAEIKRNYGPDHPNYKGGHISGSGYKVISRLGHTNLYEHRVIAEQTIGRPLLPGEVVHHIDGDRLNNAPENLQVMTVKEHNLLENRTRGRRVAGIHPETVEAAQVLFKLGWNVAHIARALRCEAATIKKWITKE